MKLTERDLAAKINGARKAGTDALVLAKMSNLAVTEGRARGWLEIRNGDVCVTATGRDALRADYRTDAEKAAQKVTDAAAFDRFEREVSREILGIAKLLGGIK